jgi:glycosyltransferase involved in cell wall biosynthesis/MoaA/NifB/PqqE/SkfB family radical SAM enzyme
MNILKIIHGYPPLYNAGSEVYSQSICEELSRKNHVTVFTREANPFRCDFEIRSEQRNASLELFFINMPRAKDGYRHVEVDKQLRKLVLDKKPDVAHIGHLNHLSTGIIDVLHELKIPIVFTLHDFWLMCPRGQFLQRNFGGQVHVLCDSQEDSKCAVNCYSSLFSGKGDATEKETDHWTSWVHSRMQETKTLSEKVDLFLAPSQYLMKRFISDFRIPQYKIKYLDYGFPLHYLTPTVKQNQREHFTFGYIGTHIPSKGVNLLIEAFKQVKGNFDLLIWGHKDEQSTSVLKKMAEADARIKFCGPYVNHNLADDVFSKVDVLVVPSIWGENSPLVIHEAQACHIPIITADHGGMKEYVHDGINGLLFKHRDINSLAEKMKWSAEHPVQMHELGKRGYINDAEGKVPEIGKHCRELEKIYSSLQSLPAQVQPTGRQTGKIQNELWRITLDTNPEDCNLECIMCEEHSPYSDFIPRLYKETGVKRRRMLFEWVERIFNESAAIGIKEIIPSTMGEPLLYKEIDRIFHLSQQHGIKINLTTNGTFPKKTVKEWAALIVPTTTDIKISCNGATAATAEAVMKGIDFEQAVQNAKEFVGYRNSYFKETRVYCRVTFQLTFMKNNMHELPEIIRLAAELDVDRVKGHHLWTHFEEIQSLSFRETADSIRAWNEIVAKAEEAAELYRKPNGEKILLENIIMLAENKKAAIPTHYECPFLGKELWISATGKISPCCAPDELRKTLGDFGNIETTTLAETMNSDPYQSLLKNYKTHALCKTCNMRKP